MGVPTEQPPAPNPLIELSDGVPLEGQGAETGNLQQYVIDGLLIDDGDTVNCSTSGDNGDADLYLRFNADAEPIPDSTNNECGSYSSNSNESCTSGPAQAGDTLFAGVHAYAGYTDLSITCNIIGEGICLARGAACSTGADCCSGSCGGKPGSRTCK